MKRFSLVIALVAAAVVVAVGGFWWSQRQSQTYTGMAERFPAETGVFVEIHKLGQWMSPQTAGKGAPVTAQNNRGTDPMLQVLGQVWAAQPVRPAELPDLLRNQPMGIGLWKTSDQFVGAALIQLGPGQAARVEKFLSEKLGKEPANVTVGGIALYKAPKLGDHKGTHNFVWGVSDTLAVMASGPKVADQVLATKAPQSLAKNPSFLSTIKHFPAEKGAFLYVRGAFLTKLASSHHGDAKANSDSDAAPQGEQEKKAPSGKSGEAGKAPDTQEQSTPAISLADLKPALKPLLSLDTINALGLWTLPPLEGKEGWQTRFWLGFNEPPKGIWRIAAEGSPAYPDMAGRLPTDGRVYVWSGGKDPARVYQLILDELQKDLPPDQMGWIRAGIGAAEGKLGLSFANDLLPTLGDQWCMVTAKGSEGTSGHGKRMGFFLTLRDSRRFEDLLKNKIAPQAHLQQQTYKGAEVWTIDKSGVFKGEKMPSLVISGGMAILTNDPQWALSTGGQPGKVYEKFAGIREKSNGLVVMDPSLWSSRSDVFTQIIVYSGTKGLSVNATFPGQAPSWNWKELDKHLASLK